MAIVEIHTPDDPRLARYRNLKATNDTRWTGRFVAEGDKLVRRLIESDFAIDSLLVGRRYLDAFRELAGERADLLVIDDAWIDDLVGFNFHRGILACARRKARPDPATLCQRAHERLTLVVCPDVQDPENLGSILRTGGALGIDGVLLGRGCCDPFSRRVLRVSMGAAFRVPIVECDDLAGTLCQLREAWGVELWAAVVEADAAPIAELGRPARLGLLVGSEGHGLAPEWLKLCDRRVTIPMVGGTDSLNVAVATGILLYHLTR